MPRPSVGRLAGPASVVALGTTLAAILASPSFDWTANALSELGVTSTGVGTPTTVWLFNGGLILGAIFGLVFARYLFRRGQSPLDRATAVCFGGTMWAMGAVGIFPMDQSLHGPVAIAYFLGISLTLAVDGAAAWRRGPRRWAAGALAGAALNLLGWVVWIAAGGPAVLGVAVPELWGSLVLSAWVLLTARLAPRSSSP